MRRRALRVSAVNAASEKLLSKLGVWQDIIAQRASCYHGMEVWDKDSFGRISFDDQSMGFSHLGHIIENAVIHHALWQKAAALRGRHFAGPGAAAAGCVGGERGLS